MKKCIYFIIYIIIAVVACRKENDEEVRYGSLEGYVMNDYGQPLEGAMITVSNMVRESTVSGWFSLPASP